MDRFYSSLQALEYRKVPESERSSFKTLKARGNIFLDVRVGFSAEDLD
jgi:hypothetical protein